jgi:hypothetical protein
MRISSYAVARPAYYDRNATGTFLVYSAVTGPHAATTRFSSTVASGKKAFVELSHAYYDRQTVAATGLNTVAWVRIASTTATYASLIFVRTDTATVGPLVDRVTSGQVTIYAGESIEGVTIDGSTGGTCNYYISSKITTFDA